MRLLIHKDYDNVCRWTAKYITKRINDYAPSKEKHFVLGLPTGSTACGVYSNLITAYRDGKVSFCNVTSFNMDEYLGLDENHPQSYKRYMKDNFFSGVDIKSENTHIPNGMAPDPEAECLAYEQAIKAAGGIELFMGGIGVNGHIAFNEPGTSLSSRTSVVSLDINTRTSNARFFDNNPQKVPASAFTVGIGTVMDAREVLILACGRQKARALQAAVEGPVSHWCPLSCLQLHPRAIIVCDEDAVEELKYGTVQYFKELEKSELGSM
jgi:glucosamine-6-phosphate deaminase